MNLAQFKGHKTLKMILKRPCPLIHDQTLHRFICSFVQVLGVKWGFVLLKA